MKELKTLLHVCQAMKVHTSAELISSVANLRADRLPRRSDRNGHRLSTTAFFHLDSIHGSQTVNLFASSGDSKQLRLRSKCLFPDAKGADPFSVPWGSENSYCFPPSGAIPAVRRKAKQYLACITLISPLWEAQSWRSIAMESCIHLTAL